MSAPPAAVLAVAGLKKHFAVGHGQSLKAVDGVDFAVAAGETLAIVGESGSGKTTLGRTIVRLDTPSSGQITLEGRDITHLGSRGLVPVYRRIQMVFQNPMTSLSPRLSVAETLGEPFRLNTRAAARERRERAATLLARVALRPELLDRLPHELSGGQRQRVGIARAIALEPALVVADEPTASLDVSTQAQIVNLLLRLQEESGLSYLFITHHLGLARHLGHKVAVMYLGRIVEMGTSLRVFDVPLHPYTAALISTRHAEHPIVLRGAIPSSIAPPPGCHFAPRCPIATSVCREVYPNLAEVEAGHRVACHHAGELRLSPRGAAA